MIKHSARSSKILPPLLPAAVAVCLFLCNTLLADPRPVEIPAVAVVTFQVTSQPDAGALRQLLEDTGQKYTQIPGLSRKYFIASGSQAGGIYEWDSMSRAKAFYDDAWYRQMTEIYGVRPQVVFLSLRLSLTA